MKIGPFSANRHWQSAPPITDGLSNTMFMGEVIQAHQRYRLRFSRRLFNDDIGAAQFMTLTRRTPASTRWPPTVRRPINPGPVRTADRVRFRPKPASRRRERRLRRRLGSIHHEPISLDVWRALSSMAADDLISGSGY